MLPFSPSCHIFSIPASFTSRVVSPLFDVFLLMTAVIPHSSISPYEKLSYLPSLVLFSLGVV